MKKSLDHSSMCFYQTITLFFFLLDPSLLCNGSWASTMNIKLPDQHSFSFSFTSFFILWSQTISNRILSIFSCDTHIPVVLVSPIKGYLYSPLVTMLLNLKKKVRKKKEVRSHLSLQFGPHFIIFWKHDLGFTFSTFLIFIFH